MFKRASSIWTLIAAFTVTGSALVYFEQRRPQRLPAADRDTTLPELWQYQFLSFYVLVDGTEAQKGLLPQIYDRFTAAEKAKSNDIPNLQSEEVKATIGYALGLKDKVEAAMLDPALKPDVKRAILKTHLVRIVLKARDVVSLVWTDADKLAKRKDPTDLTIPKFRRDLLPQGSDDEKAFQITISGEIVPFDIVDLPDGWATFKFRFEVKSLLARDLRILAGAPTIPHYARGLKLLGVATMIKQLESYSAASGEFHPVNIPAGCRTGMSSELPEEIEFPPNSEENQAGAADGLISVLGLNPVDKRYSAFFEEQVLTSPVQGVYAGYLPLESFRAAKRGLDPTLGPEWEPPIDDATQFEQVMELRAPLAISKIPSRLASLTDTAKKVLSIQTAKMEKLFVMYNGTPTEAPTIGLSLYTVELMKKKNTLKWRDTVCPAAKKMLQNQKISIDFPRWSAGDTSLRWAFATLGELAAKMVANPSADVLARVRQACPKEYCKSKTDRGPEAFLRAVARVLGPFAGNFDYVPPVRFFDYELKKFYPTLRNLWAVLRDSNLIPDAHPTEWDYLQPLLDAPTNLWASLRLGYVTFAECEYTGQKSDLRFFGDPLGLSQPLTPNHANQILSRDEKEHIWKSELNRFRDDTAFVSDVKLDHDLDVLDKLDAIFRHRPIFDVDEADVVFKKIFGQSEATVRSAVDEQEAIFAKFNAGDLTGPVGPYTSGHSTVDALSNVFTSDQMKYAQKLREIYMAQGNPTRQKEIYKEIRDRMGLDPEGKGGFDAKVAFLNAELAVKRPLYRGVLNRGQRVRKLQVTQLIQDLCNSDPLVNEREFKLTIRKLFSLSEDLNKSWRAKEMPPNVQAELDKWSRVDKENLYLSGLQLAFFALAGVTAAGCTVGTGGLCAPVLGLVLSLGATGTQVWMAVNSTTEAIDANTRRDLVKAYADLGYSTDEAAEQAMEGHGYGMAALDWAFTLPLVGQTAKSLQVGVKMLPEFTKATVRGVGRAATLQNPFDGKYRAAVRAFAAEADLKASMYYLGIESVWSDVKKIGREPMLEFLSFWERNKVYDVNWSENPAVREVFGRARLDKVPEEFAIKKWAQTISKQFGGSPRYFMQEMGTYTGSRFVKFTESLAGWERTYGRPEGLNMLRRALSATGLPAWRMARLERAITSGRGLKTMIAECQVWIDQGKTFESFLETNQVELRRIFDSLPVLKREVPNYVLLQGSPGIIFGQAFTKVVKVPGTNHYSKFGLSVPFVNFSAQSLLLKRASIALENVLWAKRMNAAYAGLGLPAATTEAHNGFQLIQAFFESARQRLTDDAAMARVDEFQEKVAKRVLDYNAKKNPNARLLSQGQMALAIGNPDLNLMPQGGQARALFNATPMNEIYAVPYLHDLADEVLRARSLERYENSEVLDELMTALHVASETAKPKPLHN